MNIKEAAVLLGIASVVVGSTAGVAAQGRGRGGPALYTVAAETTVKGTVEDLKPGPNQGMHVMLKSADTTLELVLGPSWYQSEKQFVIGKGDQIDVIGAKSTVQGRDVLLVREIRKGAETMTFRDAKGFPMWAGRGRR